ncbi:MAG TPA: helix-turn-helix domain-containing protein [Bauldia sp.]|nr:helix-turn-helix domain-containing protein [Bauldia sp.]
MLHQTIIASETLPPPVAPGDALATAFALRGAPMQFERNAEIYGEDEPAEYFYEVVTGAVRTYKVLADGRRQIGAFHLPGDVFGLEAGIAHGFSAEAVVDSTIRVARRASIVALAARDAHVAADLWTATAKSLRGAQEHMLLLGRKNAEERVASFLLAMAGISGGEIIELPMSRQDIADYLGLTIETVSRTLTHLEAKAAIALPSSRRVVVTSRASLQRLDA